MSQEDRKYAANDTEAATAHLPPVQRQPPKQNNGVTFAGRLGGNQVFTVDRGDEANAALLAKEPDAAPGMMFKEQFDLAPFLQPLLWKQAMVEGFGSSARVQRYVLFTS